MEARSGESLEARTREIARKIDAMNQEATIEARSGDASMGTISDEAAMKTGVDGTEKAMSAGLNENTVSTEKRMITCHSEASNTREHDETRSSTSQHDLSQPETPVPAKRTVVIHSTRAQSASISG